MGMQIPCEMIRYVMPIYEEGRLSPSSSELVEKHLGECSNCRELLQSELLQMKKAPESILTKYKDQGIYYRGKQFFLKRTALEILDDCKEQGITLQGLRAFVLSEYGFASGRKPGEDFSIWFSYYLDDPYYTAIEWLNKNEYGDCVYEIYLDEREKRPNLSTVEYPQTLSLIRKRTEPSELMQEFAGWMQDQYGVRLLNYTFRKRANGRDGLMLILWDDQSCQVLNDNSDSPILVDPEKTQTIASQFVLLCEKYPGFHDSILEFHEIVPDFHESANDDSPRSVEAPKDQFDVLCWSIKGSIRQNIISQLRKELHDCIDPMPDIARVDLLASPISIVCVTDQAMKNYVETGEGKALEEKIRKIVEPIDDLHAFDEEAVIQWSSLEMTDRKKGE